MELQRLSRIVIQWVRYLFVPIPCTVALIFGVGVLSELVQRPGSWRYMGLGREDMVYVGSFMALLEFMQLTLGVWSLILLDAFVHRLRGYVVVITLLALSLSVSLGYLASGMAGAPSFGRTSVGVFLYFGLPLIVSYLLGWYLQSLVRGRLGEASK